MSRVTPLTSATTPESLKTPEVERETPALAPGKGETPPVVVARERHPPEMPDMRENMATSVKQF